VLLDAPLEAEPDGLDGVATIMARAFSEGTDKHSAEEFAAELERCGATLDAHADHPGVRLSLEVPVSRLSKGLGLLADALRAPAFADSEVERLVRNRLDEIPHETANPARRAAKELSKELFPATSRMSRPRQGTEETVADIDSAAVRAFYEKHVRPATGTLVVVGDLTGTDLDALLADTLGEWTGSPGEPRSVPPVTADDTGRVVIVDRPGAVQTQLLIGRIGADRHDRVWPAQVLGTYCLGGTLTSRLDKVLREEKGYTYGVRMNFGPLRTGGSFAVQGSFRTEVLVDALAATRDLIKVDAAPFTSQEVNDAVAFFTGVSPLRYATADGVADQAATQVLAGLPDDYVDRSLALLRSVTPEAATEAYGSVVHPDDLTLVVVGDAERLADPLRASGFEDLEVRTAAG